MMKDFLLELADLMGKHGVTEMSVFERHDSWNSYAVGIEFHITSEYDKNYNETRPHQTEIVGTWMRPDDIRKHANEI